MKELVVISGKGGTGKTSVVGAFASLSKNATLADCDVDAANLHLLLAPEIRESHEFSAGSKAVVDCSRCAVCGLCEELCRFSAVRDNGLDDGGLPAPYHIDPLACEGCGVCARFCPESAIVMNEVVNGQWFISTTRFGPLVHARLGIAEENSGKLVSLVREKAREVARAHGSSLILVDGSPGIGCPVIASLTGAHAALIVTEPTVAAHHDLVRIGELTRHFRIPALVCINKCDLNSAETARIRREAEAAGMPVVGTIRYDPAVTAAMLEGVSVVEYTERGASADLRELWAELSRGLEEASAPRSASSNTVRRNQ